MLKKVKGMITIFTAAFLIAGCANAPVIEKSADQKIAAPKQKSIFELPPSEADIIKEVLISLHNQEGRPDYNGAKAKLGIFLQENPKSKWVGSVQALILIINNVLDLQEKVRTEALALEKVNAEKAKMRKDYKYSEDKYQIEAVKLQQENEQLKNDIALLKKLEIQLDKREKMLK